MHRVHPHVRTVMEEMGLDDPAGAVRAKARALVQEFATTFGETPPFNLDALASYRGLMHSQDAPKHSPDSEIAPEDGRVVLRVNRERPIVRQRFSIGHEIGHTLFPDYHQAVRCRKPPERDWADSDDQLESLCDVAASEILFPSPWFDDAVSALSVSAASLRQLATRFNASSEATIRRFIEVYGPPAAAIFCSWKLKPTEMRRQAADRHQGKMFGGDVSEPLLKLRIDYSVLNDAFRGSCKAHLPKDKSLAFEGSIAGAALTQEPCDSLMWLDLGSVGKQFHTHVLPVFTQDDQLGPGGAVSVVVVVRPA